MQKTELIARVAKESGATQADTAKIINKMIDVVVDSLKAGDKVTLTGFGTFEVRETAARVGTNPSTRQKINIPAGKRAAFSAGAVLKGAVSGKEASADGAKGGAKGGKKAGGASGKKAAGKKSAAKKK